MLTRNRRSQKGMTLIEIVITLTIVGIVILASLPGFSTWIRNSRIRTTAEALQNGLQIARAEAVRRNTLIGFYLTDTLDASCTLATTGTHWVVSFTSPQGNCAANDINEAYPADDTENNPAPRIIQRRSAAEGSAGVNISSGQNTFQFNGLGRLTALVTRVDIDVTSADGSTCAGSGTGNEAVRCLRVQVSGAGQIRLCDPARAATDPQGCLP